MIKQAIIPLAGQGTRLLPLTSVLPKELLPINGKPGLEYIIEECIKAGIKEIIFIISKKKQMIKFVYQNSPKGTGDAVLKCKNLIKSKYFLMLMPDDLIIKKNCSSSLIKLHKKYNSSIIASKIVNRKTVSRWGIFNLKKINKKNFIIKDVIEKPSMKLAPSNYAVIGRYILPKTIFDVLKKQKPGQNGEIHITDAIRLLINKNNKFIGHIFAGKYLDCGTMKGYINSTIEISKL